ncbi:hypothetical protein BgiMline_034392 [Biomphalaria glabrata]
MKLVKTHNLEFDLSACKILLQLSVIKNSGPVSTYFSIHLSIELISSRCRVLITNQLLAWKIKAKPVNRQAR